MVVNITEKTHRIRVDETQLEQAKSFKYLGSRITQDGRHYKEICKREGATGI